MDYRSLDTPAVIIDQDIMMANIRFMQDYADKSGVALRPHTKTHKIPEISKLMEQAGAKGITVAKVGEAEIMAAGGLKDIFVANEVVGDEKYRRIIQLMKDGVDLSFGLDSIEQAALINQAFEGSGFQAQTVIEIEVGENRSGVIEEEDYRQLLAYLKASAPSIHLRGVFSHDGNSYNADNLEQCREIHLAAQKRTLRFVDIAKEMGYDFTVVSIGSTPSMLHDFPILKGITEIRPGTYVLMDASMSAAYGDLSRAAVTVLATVISRPTAERVILDVGAKGITMQTRTKGITAVEGMGLIKNHAGVHIFDVYDEHAIIYNKAFRDKVRVGDKVEIIPVHVCPMMNLHEEAHVVKDGQVVETYKIAGRGKLK